MKKIISKGIFAEIVALITAIFGSYRIVMYTDTFIEPGDGIDYYLSFMCEEIGKFWPIFTVIAVVTAMACLIYFLKKKK